MPVGDTLGLYRIVGKLGGGGMGDVYRAHDARLDRDVALKVLPAAVTANPERLARFRREARALAALNHPHIVTIFSIEEADGVPFMTMELVEGRSLEHLVSEGGLPLGRFFDIGIALADALSAAHRKSIIHRDLKPANVMISDDGLVKVLDFGLAREAGPREPSEHDATALGLTQAGFIVGTVPYMSPEQIEGWAVDPRTDLFSLGVVLYEMVSGTRPFRGDSSPALMSSILRDRPRPLTELRTDVPEGVWRLAARCLEKAPGERIASAQDVHAGLKELRRDWESGATRRASPGAPASGVTIASDLRVAVLPFSARGGAEAVDLAEGLTDDITAGLSRFQHLRVVSRRDAEAAKGESADARAAERLRARYLVEGTVRAAGSSVRVNARLVDTTTDTHIWAETYDRALGNDPFALQDDLTARMVATIGDTNGVLARSLGASLKDRDPDSLTVGELVIRFFGYGQVFLPDEHRRLRASLERAIAGEPGHAQGWACLAVLYEQEYSQHLNPLPNSRQRSADAARRSVALDPNCQTAWRGLAVAHFFNRDLTGLRVAAERVIALNPWHTTTMGYIGCLLAYAGEWDRGIAIVERTIDLNPNHPAWVHYALATNRYRVGAFDLALIEAKRGSLAEYVWTPLCIAVAAGQLGLADEARAALDLIRKNHPAYINPAAVRELWSTWQWDADLVDRLLDGFGKALALVDRPAPAPRPPSSPWLVRPAAPDAMASIAVMPFVDLSPTGDQEWFCDGIAEELLNALTPLQNLRVAARASAFSLRGRSDDLKTIGEKLNVTTVLGGSVRRAGDRVRITVQLSEVETGFQLWSERYDRDLTDIFDVQDEIARTVAERLKVTLVDGPLDRLARLVERGTTDVDAYQIYLQGRALLTRRGAAIPRAIELFERAVALDPNYSVAWAAIAEAHTVLAFLGVVRGAESRARALAAAWRAIELSPSSAAGHAALGVAVLAYANDRSQARQEFERALELNPHDVQGRCWYALFYLQWVEGQFDQGVSHARRALADDPLSAYTTMIVAACLGTAGRLDEASAMGRLAMERDPESYVARWATGVVLIEAGRAAEAIALLETTPAESSALELISLAFAYQQAGRAADATAIHERVLGRATARYVPRAFLALSAAAAGRHDDAIAYAREAWDDREPPFILFARHFPQWRPFHADPRFQDILREMDTTGRRN
jgi:TolB-like protein/Flp pilus assembly protein TadD